MTAAVEDLLMRDLYVASPEAGLAALIVHLEIVPSDLVGDVTSAGFMPARRNGAEHRPVAGDFDTMMTVYLWGWSLDRLHAALERASSDGFVIAIESNRSEQEDFIFSAGMRHDGVLSEDAALQEVTILRPEMTRPQTGGRNAQRH